MSAEVLAVYRTQISPKKGLIVETLTDRGKERRKWITRATERESKEGMKDIRKDIKKEPKLQKVQTCREKEEEEGK